MWPSVLLRGFFLVSVTSALVHQNVGNCDSNQTCAANLRLQTNGNSVSLLAGYFITSSTVGENVSSTTRERITKNSAFKYVDLASSLTNKMKTELSSNNCPNRTQHIALTLAEAARRVAAQCTTIGGAGCAFEAPVFTCGSATTSSTALVPWSLVLPSNASNFDVDSSNFDIFTALLRFAGMESLLTKSPNITVLLPNDKGMARTAHYIGAYRGNLTDEKAVFESYKTAARNGVDLQGTRVSGLEVVRFIIGYHVLSGQIPQVNFSGLPRSFSTSAFISILSTGAEEILDISRSTPNARIIQGDLKVEGSVVVHALNSGLIPFEDDFESMSPFDCSKPSSLMVSSEPVAEATPVVQIAAFFGSISPSTSAAPSLSQTPSPSVSVSTTPSSSSIVQPSNTPSRSPATTPSTSLSTSSSAAPSTIQSQAPGSSPSTSTSAMVSASTAPWPSTTFTPKPIVSVSNSPTSSTPTQSMRVSASVLAVMSPFSASRSVTASISTTPSISPSMSPSSTTSVLIATASASQTSTLAASSSITPSPAANSTTITNSPSASSTMSAIAAATRSASASATASASMVPNTSISVSPSSMSSQTPTMSSSASIISSNSFFTASANPSVSISVSSTASPSVSSSPSTSMLDHTSSPVPEPSATMTISATASSTLSPSSSVSMSSSPTQTAATASASISRRSSSTPTVSRSPSVSQVASATVTPSTVVSVSPTPVLASNSPTMSSTPSGTATVFGNPGVTASSSPSATPSASTSGSTSSSFFPSATGTNTLTSSPVALTSITPSISPTFSNSSSFPTSVTPSPTASSFLPSSSASSTATPTPSFSPGQSTLEQCLDFNSCVLEWLSGQSTTS